MYGPMDVTYLKVESKTDTSLNIAWNNTYNNKCTTNYNVTWINLETSQLKYSINSANKLYHNITGLKACTLYQYDVDTVADLGQHSGGTGRVSKTDVLEQIHSLVLGYDGGFYFVLRWQAPSDMTCINRYCVCWTKLGETKEHCFHITTGYLSYIPDVNIETCTNYTVKVSAINTNYHLYSHNVSISFRTRPKEVTYLKVESKTDTSLNIAWNNTYNNSCTTNYNVTWTNLETSQVKYSINSANKLYHNITGLKACTLYEYNVDTLADLGQHSGETGRVSKTDVRVPIHDCGGSNGPNFIVVIEVRHPVQGGGVSDASNFMVDVVFDS
uniref:Fibronectin type-III domain-containing protein n=1 Tax=Timema douglasi TaxID=61478 RepID=A0A7R8VTG2_TIMDO|nr:unnamed protein product [Timema douglasi]